MTAQPQIEQTPSPEIKPPHLEVLPEPKPEKRIRNGKIARLPYLERDMVNRMLRDHIPYEKIVGALDQHGILVTERNVSNWKTHGGYKEWAAEQDRALETRLLQDNLTEHLRKTDAGQLPEVGLQLAATHLSQYFLKPETRRQLTTDPAKCGQAIAHICRLSRQIQALQKYRDDASRELGYSYNPERIRRHDEKRVEVTRNIYSTGKLGELTKTPDVAARNFIPKELSPQLPR